VSGQLTLSSLLNGLLHEKWQYTATKQQRKKKHSMETQSAAEMRLFIHSFVHSFWAAEKKERSNAKERKRASNKFANEF